MAFIATPLRLPFNNYHQRTCHSSKFTLLKHSNHRSRHKYQMLTPTPPTVTPDLPIVVGSVALAIPFFIAAVLFGERILRQRNCESCKGSGLVPSARGVVVAFSPGNLGNDSSQDNRKKQKYKYSISIVTQQKRYNCTHFEYDNNKWKQTNILSYSYQKYLRLRVLFFPHHPIPLNIIPLSHSPPIMDNPIDPLILRSRGQAALRSRQSLLLSSLRHTLITIRAQLKTTTPHTNSTHSYLPPATLAQVLHLSHLIQLLTHLTSLHSIPPTPSLITLPTTHSPKTSTTSSHPSSPDSQTQLQPSTPSDGFQRRTFYKSFPIDERRAPTADWPIIPSTPVNSIPSLSFNLSTDTLHSLDSLPVSPNPPPLPYAHGYAGFRVDNPYPEAKNNSNMDHVEQDQHISRIQQQRRELQTKKLQFFQPSVEVVNVVRLRDTVFEIGVDGRIRKHTPT